MGWLLRREEGAGQGVPENPRQAAGLILAAARAGDLDAQALLGQILLDGHGIERDPALALRWFRIAAARGHAMAANMAGRCLEHGWGCAADPAQAARHYNVAAARGLDWGLYNLANLLATGRGVERDEARAFACYRQAAEQGHAKSMNLVGRYLEEGRVGPPDPVAAREWYRRSAEAGDFRGQFSHAVTLLADGHLDEALAWLERALALGNLNFLRVARGALLTCAEPRLTALTLAYHARAAALGDDSDREAERRAWAQVAEGGIPA
ncbi:tetratricopeptide repeat protein [Stutzerimonas azotifigens]|uniref:tetratricopeptide repeat protein n=1 Tax=Stutzerimonas azotifigens TaxID=291995 RepID=UPI00040C6370|nr:tetratricopeptide repeat protein [Stutzerimonas azotifigens]